MTTDTTPKSDSPADQPKKKPHKSPGPLKGACDPRNRDAKAK
jgi:hypothetical protein